MSEGFDMAALSMVNVVVAMPTMKRIMAHRMTGNVLTDTWIL